VKNILNADESIDFSGFGLGFIHSFNRNSFDKNPFISILRCSVFDCCTSITTTVASLFVPFQVRFIIPLAVIASCTHHMNSNKPLIKLNN
jgi:hypothetical protein